MKANLPMPVIVVTIVVALAVVGFIVFRATESQPSASTDLGAKADLSKLQNMTPKDIKQMQDEMAKASKQRAATTQ